MDTHHKGRQNVSRPDRSQRQVSLDRKSHKDYDYEGRQVSRLGSSGQKFTNILTAPISVTNNYLEVLFVPPARGLCLGMYCIAWCKLVSSERLARFTWLYGPGKSVHGQTSKKGENTKHSWRNTIIIVRTLENEEGKDPILHSELR